MKTKIMIVVPYLTDGGAERVASLWANFLAKQYDTTLLTYYPMNNEYPLDGEVKRINLYPNKIDHDKRIKFCRFINKLHKVSIILKDESPDLVIPFLSHANALVSLARKNKKTVVTQTIRVNPWADPNTTIKKFIRDHFIKKEKSVIVQNAEQAEYFNSFKHVKTFVVCNPVNPAISGICKKEYSDIKNIVALGRLHNQKNYKMMIDAIAILLNEHHLNVHLDIYGQGPERDNLLKYISDCNLENNITLKGRTNDPFNTIINYDLFLMTSLFEGFPNSLLEAMALGMPVISTNCKTGPKDLIENGINGILLESFNAQDLANNIININDKQTLKKFGINAKLVSKRFSKEESLSQLKNCIKQLLSGELDGRNTHK